MSINISRENWGSIGNQNIYLFRLQNSSGAYAEITNYGATIVSIVVPDNAGKMENVIIGFPDIDGYIDDECYIGTTVGRYANRISGAGFKLNGKAYKLDTNDGKNSLHGGFSVLIKRFLVLK
jgi:aldose 1-epimerase